MHTYIHTYIHTCYVNTYIHVLLLSLYYSFSIASIIMFAIAAVWYDSGVCEQITPPDKNTLWSSSLKNKIKGWKAFWSPGTLFQNC